MFPLLAHSCVEALETSRITRISYLCFYFFQYLLAVAPKIMPFTFGDDPVFAGQAVQLNCFVVEGDQPLRIEWDLNGNRALDVLDDLGVEISSVGRKGSLLSIDSLLPQHAGTYTCTATNRAGTVRWSSFLSISGKTSVIN